MIELTHAGGDLARVLRSEAGGSVLLLLLLLLLPLCCLFFCLPGTGSDLREVDAERRSSPIPSSLGHRCILITPVLFDSTYVEGIGLAQQNQQMWLVGATTN
jgi:hypothetical protein